MIRTRKIALYGILIALAMILSYIESMMPVFTSVPGVKLGLPNIVIVFAIYFMDFRSAACISLIRVLLTGLMFGNVFSIIYSASGAAVSLVIMYILYRSRRFSTVGVSVSGGVGHNIGQIIAAVFVTGTAQIAFYLPVLCVSGIIAGICIGIVAGVVTDRVKKAGGISEK